MVSITHRVVSITHRVVSIAHRVVSIAHRVVSIAHRVCFVRAACSRRKDADVDMSPEENRSPKKPRLVFTDIQRRTLHAIFKETKRPSKEMQMTIAQQLGLELTTVANFFMNARRRSLDKWQDDSGICHRDSLSCAKS